MPWHHPLWHHPLALARHHSLLMVPPLGVPRAGLPAPVLVQAPMSPAAPPPLFKHPQVGPLTPMPCWTPCPTQAKSALFFHPLSAVALVVTTARVAERPYIHVGRRGLKTFTWHGGGSQSRAWWWISIPLKKR